MRIKTHPQSDAKKRFHAGFAPKWSAGPYTVVKRISPEVYVLGNADGEVKVTSEDMKPHVDNHYSLRSQTPDQDAAAP